MVGLAAGLGTGWTIDLPAFSTAAATVTAAGSVSDAVAESQTTAQDPDRHGAAVDGPFSATGLGATSDRYQLREAPPAPELPDPPEPIDPNALDAAGLSLADRQAGLLSTAVPTSASGQLVVVPGSEPAPQPDRPVRTVRVEVEAGLDIDPALFAATVMRTLNDPRGWGADGSVSFARTDGEAQIRVVLASPDLVDAMCAPLDTAGKVSCGRNGHAALNHTRWVQATAEHTDRTVYREYLVNHEVGHLLGHPHVTCPGPGQVAPIMVQQTYAVAPCVPNGWPFPDAG